MTEKSISHDGVVDSVRGKEVLVRITSYAACHECHAKAACMVTEEKEKFLRVNAGNARFKTGDNVRVVLDRSLGFRALFLGYVLPFILVLAALVLTSAMGLSELIAGLASLSVLPPYYFALRLFRHRLERKFSFFLQKS